MFHRAGQFCGTGLYRVIPMFFFLVAHLFDNRTTLCILWRQAVEVAVEMCAYLAFGLRYKAQAPPVPEYAAGSSDCKCPRVPERAQFADILAQFMNTLFTPREVVELFVSGVLHLGLDLVRLLLERLALERVWRMLRPLAARAGDACYATSDIAEGI